MTITKILLRVGVAAAVTIAGAASESRRAEQGGGRALALVGGTLIDGFGSTPIRNSVVLVEGERITAVGQVGTLAVPAGAEVISTEGMTVLPGLWDMHVHLMINGHSDYTHWDKTYPSRFEKEIMPAVGAAVAHGRRDERARSRRTARGEHQRARSRSIAARFPARRCTSPARSSSTSRIRAPSSSAGA